VALYMMLQTATNDTDNYRARHAMFCTIVADLSQPFAELSACCASVPG